MEGGGGTTTFAIDTAGKNSHVTHTSDTERWDMIVDHEVSTSACVLVFPVARPAAALTRS